MLQDNESLAALYRDHVADLERAYARVLEQASFDGVLIHSGTAQAKSIFDDQFWPLRITPHFQHWLPLSAPDCALLILPGRKPVLYRNVAVSFWEGVPVPEREHFWDSFEVVDVQGAEPIKDLWPRDKRIAFVGENKSRAADWQLPEEAWTPPELASRLDLLRAHKSAYEIACLAEANVRAAAGHAAVLAAFHDGDYSELQLHLKYLEATLQDDPETPYKNIVALGEHAATLHHVDYGRRATGAQSLLLDAGATCLGYHSDITRTAVKGDSAAADAFGGLIDKLEVLQQDMCRRAVAGVPYQRLHNESHELLAEVMRDVGLATGSAAELVEHGITRKFLPHGLGHSLGLQTHDVGCALVRPEPRNPFLRNTADIADGQVFTIEPGCYFIAPLLNELRASEHAGLLDWGVVDAMRPFGGVRIEDDLAVLGGQPRNLTREVLPQ